jgi:hypothetical protein
MRRALLAAFLLLPLPAFAGAWTQAEGEGQVILGAIASAADRTFGDATPIRFRRLLMQTYAEYGWRDGITLVAATETASVDVRQNNGAPFHAQDNALSAGLRWRLDPYFDRGDWGVLSVEASLRWAGAFNFAVSANRDAGGQGGQLRLLYGNGFRLWDRDGFVSAELGEDFFAGDRPNETPFDLTAGLWLGQNHLLLAQSFNLFAQKGRIAAYPAFDSHKLELSWVYRWSPRMLFQLGAFVSPAGSNALVERGLGLSVWRRF